MKDYKIEKILRETNHLEKRIFTDGTGNKVTAKIDRIKKIWVLEIKDNESKFKEKYDDVADVVDTILQYLIEDDIKHKKIKGVI